MEVIVFGERRERRALKFGSTKVKAFYDSLAFPSLQLQINVFQINLHQSGKEFLPHAKNPMPGSVDLCLVSNTPLDEVS